MEPSSIAFVPATEAPPRDRLGVRWRRAVAGLLSAAHLVLAGCGLFQTTVDAPVMAVGAVLPGRGSKTLDVTALQHRLLAFGDDEISRTSAALDAYATALGTPEAAERALTWKIANASAMTDVLTGANPQMHLLDTISMITLTRMSLQAMGGQGGEAAALAPWLELSEILERNIWQIAADFLEPAQLRELHDALGKLSMDKARTQEGLFFRPQEFAATLRLGGASFAKEGGTLSSLFSLDPWSGLDPAVREIAESRLFAERAMFTLQRTPNLLRWQTELTVRQLLRLPEVQGLLKNLGDVGGHADKMANAVELIGRTANELPERISAEREALVSDLKAQESKLSQLAAEVRQTLTAGEEMSKALNATIISFDALMVRFGVGAPEPPGPAAGSSSEGGGKPFDILEYAKTAEAMTVLMKQLDAVLKEFSATLDTAPWDKRLADIQRLSESTQAEAKGLLNHAFLLGAGLVALALAAALTYRWAAPRLDARRRPAA